jgi:hypothetical protein
MTSSILRSIVMRPLKRRVGVRILITALFVYPTNLAPEAQRVACVTKMQFALLV